MKASWTTCIDAETCITSMHVHVRDTTDVSMCEHTRKFFPRRQSGSLDTLKSMHTPSPTSSFLKAIVH